MADSTLKVRAALQRHPLLLGTPPALVDELVAGGKIETFAPKAFLIHEKAPSHWYWILCSGSVRVFYSSPEGFEVTVKIFHAPAAWAEMEVLTGHSHIEDCVAVDRAVVLKVPRALFERSLDTYPRFIRNVLDDTCARFLIAAQNERTLAFLPLPTRLANLLLSYVRVFGVPVEGGIAFRIKLTQAELANGLGAARRSVARTLALWKKEGVLGARGAAIIIRDVDRLVVLSEPEILGIDWVAGSDIHEGRGSRSRHHR